MLILLIIIHGCCRIKKSMENRSKKSLIKSSGRLITNIYKLGSKEKLDFLL